MSPTGIQRVNCKEFTCPDHQVSVSLHFTLLLSLRFMAFFFFPSLRLPGSISTEAAIKHPHCDASQCSARTPALPARRRIRKLKSLTCLSNKIIHVR